MFKSIAFIILGFFLYKEVNYRRSLEVALIAVEAHLTKEKSDRKYDNVIARSECMTNIKYGSDK